MNGPGGTSFPPRFKVLFVASEASPLVKIGGLGDVAGSLPRVLRKAGHDVRLAVPHYGIIKLDGHRSKQVDAFSIPFMGVREDVAVTEVMIRDETPVYLIGNTRYFGRTAVYGEPDDLERFLFFSLAVMELPRRMGWQPDIINCHDWHTGVIPALLKVARSDGGFYASCASVFTINNLAYQGSFDDEFAARAGLQGYLLPPGDPLRAKTYSMMGLGICYADIVSTVSETYAREILTPEYGMGLEALLGRRRDSLYGIRNGVDYEVFNPAEDGSIVANYNTLDIAGKLANKLALQKKAGLKVDAGIPLIAMAVRLVWQKGLDITAEAMKSLLAEKNVQFVLQGSGEAGYREALQSLQDQYPDKARMFFAFDPALAEQVYAGADIFLMPSRFEPCGLSHLIAMRYGAVPVVRRTGGLAETVPDCSPDLSSGLGFVFEKYDAADLLAAIRRAISGFEKKEAWLKLVVRDMEQDFSWAASVPKYEALFGTARQRLVR